MHGTSASLGWLSLSTLSLFCLLLPLGQVRVLASGPRTLSFEERVQAQEAIERVYYSHRIWPEGDLCPRPPFEETVPRNTIEAKVTDDLKKREVLARWWGQQLTDANLEAELERMGRSSRAPEVLKELRAVLGHDEVLIRECLAGPILTQRVLESLYSRDPRIHGALRKEAEALREKLEPGTFREAAGARYQLQTFALEGQEAIEGARACAAVALPPEAFARLQQELPAAGTVGPVEETASAFVIRRTVSSGTKDIEVESAVFLKEPLDEWLAGDPLQGPKALPEMASPARAETPEIAPDPLSVDAWAATASSSAPTLRYLDSAVWTGTEMIIWGGYDGVTPRVNTGGRYNPATDSWTTTKTAGAPSARNSHSAVWTGTEMIIWGGNDGTNLVNTGGRYNPTTDGWTATNSSAAPSGRQLQTAVWSGTEMIVWGGNGGSGGLATGGLYNPSTDGWAATSTTGEPSARYDHTAVWTGTVMTVWGGYSGVSENTGGQYAPATDSWTATDTSAAPSPRFGHTAVWTGAEMIIWGGKDSTGLVDTGGAYDPAGNAWTATNTAGAPSAREWHTAVWSGTEMIVWGGDSGVKEDTGGRFSAAGNTWTVTSTANAPSGRSQQTAVWTGTEMIVWGGDTGAGYANTGGCYAPDCSVMVPGAPSAPSFSAVACTSQTVTWSAVAYAASYDVWRATGSSCTGAAKITAAPVTATSYGDTGLTAGATYSYYVTANNACGTSSNGACATSVVGPAVPASPAAPTFTAVTTTTLTVNWSGVASATNYDVWRTTGASCTGAAKITSTPISGFSFTDTGRLPGTKYSYSVTANGACGTSTNGACGTVTTSSGSTPGEVSPGSTAATAMTWATDKTTLSWQSTLFATGYRLYRGTPANLPNLLTSAADSCKRYDGTALSVNLNSANDMPAAGSFLWFLVTGYTGLTEGSAGYASAGPRIVNSTGTCP